jgi:hypothetical protein
MKTLLILPIFLVSFVFANGQCKDIYEKPCNCPTLEDSLLLYINAISVIEFYDYNKAYQKTGSKDIRLDFEKREVFKLMEQSRRLFHVVRKYMAEFEEDPKFANTAPKNKYIDIPYNQYFKQINKYRFNQRELENQIINRFAPFPMYDTRISPILINEYRCVDTESEFYGDLVNIPMYLPIVVKPDGMLSDSERVVRDKILKSYNVHDLYLKMKERKLDILLNKIQKDISDTTSKTKRLESYEVIDKNSLVVVHNNVVYITEQPIFYRDAYSGAGLIGFMVGRKFQKIEPKDYKTFALPKYCIDLLKDDKRLEFYLKTVIGGYYDGFYYKKL